jgi:arginyl-tRNA synthetase
MLVKWEAKEPEVYSLWEKMNGWVYKGFDITYKNLGVNFDKIYYESETYLLGKKIVLEGLNKGILFKKEDGSIWADLSDDGLDQKLLLRADGTSVYMTQDIGTAHQRFSEFDIDNHIYVVGNEQNYHFQVLKLILKKLGYNWSDSIYHLSYGMVELPEGKMKSREGTVVDADDLIDEMVRTAREKSQELGKLDGYSNEEKEQVYKTIALGALKYFILKVDPKKGMMFNPNESIDFNGNTGPFIQYTYARIKSILRKANENNVDITDIKSTNLNEKEVNLLKMIYEFPEVGLNSAKNIIKK